MGVKQTEMFQKNFLGLCFFVATYGNEVFFVGGLKKTQTY